MNTHLPEPVLRALSRFATQMAEGVAGDSGKIHKVASADEAFDCGPMTSTARRALVAKHGQRACDHRLRGVALSNLGFEIVSQFRGVERRFRLCSASYTASGAWRVTSNSASILTSAARNRSSQYQLWSEPHLTPTVDESEQWVLAYIPNRLSHTLDAFMAGLPVDVVGSSSPFRLVLDHQTPIPVEPTWRGRFSGEDPGLGDDDRPWGVAEEDGS